MFTNPVKNNIAVGKEQCPKCAENGKDRSKDNLHRYEDGHAWCFSCNYREPSDAMRLMEQLVLASKGDKEAMRSIIVRPKPYILCPAGASCMSTDGEECKYCKDFDTSAPPMRSYPEQERQPILLPYDSVKTIPVKALTWLDKYDIGRAEIIAHDLMWSDHWQRLIFPIRGENRTLLAWTGRYFGPVQQPPSRKWWHSGDVSTICHIVTKTGWESKPIVVVEDPVSAIKVGRHLPAMPLFGSHMSLRTAVRLRHLTKRVILWLDADKFKEAQTIIKRLELMGVSADVVYTEKDPKEQTDDFIKAIV